MPDGTQVSGQVIRLGEIASLATSETGSGALIPIGGGKLQVLDNLGADTANALQQGERPSTVDLYLYEGETKPIYIREDRSVMDTIRAGGLVAVVIALLGVVGLLLAAVRFGLVIEAGRFNEGTLNTVVSAVRNRQETTGHSLAGSTGRVIRALLGEKTRDREALMDAAGAALLKETPKIQRFGTAIMVIAAIAPLLGLLGTVTGMISTFEIITEHGTGDPKLLSGGISEALITTQLGLVVAIPMVLLGNLLNGQGSNALRNCERAAFAIINAMTEEQPDDGHSGEKNSPRLAKPRRLIMDAVSLFSALLDGGFVMPPLLGCAFLIWFGLGERYLTLRRGDARSTRALFDAASKGEALHCRGLIDTAAYRLGSAVHQHGAMGVHRAENLVQDLVNETDRHVQLVKTLVVIAPLQDF